MKQTKKHNFIRRLAGSSRESDGYVLLYALIITAVLTALVLGVFSVSLNNLNAQKQAAVDMQARYEAEGYVEMVVAGFTGYLSTDPHKASEARSEESEAIMLAKGAAFANLEADIVAYIDSFDDPNAEYVISVEEDVFGSPNIDMKQTTGEILPENVDDIITLPQISVSVPLIIETGNTTLRTTVSYDIEFVIDEDSKETQHEDPLDPTQITGYLYSAYSEVQTAPTYEDYTITQTASNGND